MITITHLKGFHPFVQMETTPEDINHSYQYAIGITQPRYPMPAIPNHLNWVAAEPLQAWEDFNAIGWHGKYANRNRM